MAGLSGIGDAVMLWDLGWRIWGFIDDVRHAQDDFIMLRNEAHCLRECTQRGSRREQSSSSGDL